MTNKNTGLISSVNLADPEQVEALSQKIYQQMQNEGKPLQELLNIPNDFLEEIYGIAYNYYNQGKYKEAISLFYLGVSIAPKNPKHVFGFAASLYQIKDYANAAIGFYIAYAVNKEDPLTAYYAADCLLKLEQKNEAEQFLNYAIQAAGNIDKHAVLKERCKLIKETLRK